MSSLPPYFEEYYPADNQERWVGASDPYTPQLAIERGPSLVELKEAAKAVLYFTSRTDDMDLEAPNDVEGEIEAKVIDVHASDDPNLVHFLAHIEQTTHVFLHNVTIWAWNYDGQRGNADFRV